MPPPSSARCAHSPQRKRQRRKRSSSCTDTQLPTSKRSCSTSPTKTRSNQYQLGCIDMSSFVIMERPSIKQAPEPLCLPCWRAASKDTSPYTRRPVLQRDIVINNLMMNEDDDDPSWPSYLIDLDLAIKEQRESLRERRGKPGTTAFMAIGALLDEQHSFMHDLESFFWVLFWDMHSLQWTK